MKDGFRKQAIMKHMFWSLLPAQILTSLTSSLGQIINSLIVGNSLPSEALAAMSFSAPVSMILIALGVAISAGAYVICGDYIGRARYDEIHRTFTSAIKGIAITGLVLTVLVEIFSSQLAMLLGARDAALDMTAAYLRGLFIGLVPLLVNNCLIAFLNMGGQSPYVVAGTILYAVVNLLLGILNVTVVHGGIFGMGVVSSISALACTIFYIIKFRRNRDLGHLEKGVLDWREFGRMLRLGASNAGIHLFSAVRNMLLNIACMKFFGTEAVSATGILMNATAILECVGFGIGNVATMTSSVAVGSRNSKAVEQAFGYVQTRGVGVEIIVALVQFLGARPLAMLFGAEGTVLELSIIAIRMYAISQPLQQFYTYNYIYFSNSLKRITLNFILGLFGTFLIPVAIMFIFGSLMGISGVWMCYPATQVIMIIALFVIAWVQLKHAPRNLGEWLWVDKSINVPEGHTISVPATNDEEVVQISQKIQDMCLKCGVDRRNAYISGLCLEEIAGNVIDHGFTKGKPGKDYVVDAFAVVDDDKITLSIRDNAPSFNPKERSSLYVPDPEHPEKNIGIRMVEKLANRVVYQSTFGLNVLNIEILRPKAETVAAPAQ